MVLKSYAKINLSLNVNKKMKNGFMIFNQFLFN